MAEHLSADNVHTRRIAEFVAGVRYEQIPAEVRERLKLLILDSLGVSIPLSPAPGESVLDLYKSSQ